ncbi:MAG: shikimate kinase [Bacteroidetes bacterium]|nr:MAG: shikimate kinase [Bacteroidota bacterium]TAG88299.1 MAG: shikimate kinase [Bacteroidota bacterium]
MKVAFLGMPAAGKSTMGRKLAEMLGYTFIDLDKWIETQEKLTIQEIFTRFGENYFREMERVALHQTLKKDNIILATGGGTPCFYDNLEMLRKNFLCVFIDAPIESIAQRIIKNQKARPLFINLKEDEIIEKLKNLHQNRLQYYNKAHIYWDNSL